MANPKRPTCATCDHCKKAPRRFTQYQGYYGWCEAPTPAYLPARSPLISHNEMRGKTCALYRPAGEGNTVVVLYTALRALLWQHDNLGYLGGLALQDARAALRAARQALGLPEEEEAAA